MTLSQTDFERLLRLRSGLRRFLRGGERQAEAVGLTPAQHELLLAIQGHPDPSGPTVGDVAEHLVLRHHSAVGLIDRATAAGLVRRNPDRSSKAVVRLALTRAGRAKLDALVDLHRAELAHLAPTMSALRDALEQGGAWALAAAAESPAA